MKTTSVVIGVALCLIIGQLTMGASINPTATLLSDTNFTDIGAQLAGVFQSSVLWGDYDNDGDLDLLVVGRTDTGTTSRIYRNDEGEFVDINANLVGVMDAHPAAWIDFDGDGDLDLFLSGATSPDYQNPVTKLYRNDSGTFVDVNVNLPTLVGTQNAWGDYDNDGDLDLLLAGSPDVGSGKFTRLYRNDGDGTFTPIPTVFPDVWGGASAWGDYDNDGDLDVVISGYGPGSICRLYRNDGNGTFVDVNAGFMQVQYEVLTWGDYDNDGDLDLLASGNNNFTKNAYSAIYRNDGGTFTNIAANLQPVVGAATSWGDYDGDGDLDVVLVGKKVTGDNCSFVYRNDGGTFTPCDTTITATWAGTVAWGDYDNDGDLDIALSGATSIQIELGPRDPITKIYRNTRGANVFAANTIPARPVALSAEVSGSTVELSWQKASDNETPQSSLSYNVRIGTTSGGIDVVSPMSDVTSGQRRLVQLGNTNLNNSWTIQGLPAGTYYWSVQTIDGAYAGSPFASEGSFEVTTTHDSTNVVAWWHFDEGSGNILHDASPYHNDGVIHNCQWVPAKFGNGLHFDGLTSYVVLPNSPSLKMTDEFTLEAWFSPDTLLLPHTSETNQGVILSNLGPYPCGGGYQIYLDDPGGFRFDDRIPNCESNFSGHILIPWTHEFYHVACIYRQAGSAISVVTYFNGALADSTILTGPIQYDQTPYFYIGTNRDGRPISGRDFVREFPGIIDEIRISNYARDPREFNLSSLVSSTDHIDFGLVQVGGSAIQNIDLVNTSFTETLHVDTITVFSAKFVVNTVPFVLVPGEHRMLTVTYAPTDTDVDTAWLRLAVSDSGVAPVSVRLTGKGFTLAPAPIIGGVTDVPNDQGRQVRVRWYPSVYDTSTVPESLRVSEYSLWRRVDDPVLAKTIGREAAGEVNRNGHCYRLLGGKLWDFIVTVPAVHFEQYAVVAPTLYNTTIAGSMHWSVFTVAAHTPAGEFFFSEPDSGYSTDDIYPTSPANVAATWSPSDGVVLTWDNVVAPDLERYRVYRATSAAVVPIPSALIGSTRETVFNDHSVLSNQTYYYLVTAVDSSGNESVQVRPVLVTTYITDVHDDAGIPTEYSLGQNYPNPFNPTTVIRYGLPEAAVVRLTVFNALGQTVAELIDGEQQAAGYHAIEWQANTMSSGVYFYRLTAGEFSEVKKMLLIQ